MESSAEFEGPATGMRRVGGNLRLAIIARWVILVKSSWNGAFSNGKYGSTERLRDSPFSSGEERLDSSWQSSGAVLPCFADVASLAPSSAQPLD